MTEKKRSELGGFLQQLAIFASPFVVLLVLYLLLDPFKVVWSYESYYPTNVAGGVSLNPGYVATQNFRQRVAKEHYDSFILGNSRSIYYPISAWQEMIGSGSHCYHFDAASESLLGIWQKLRFIEQSGCEIRHILWVADADLLAKTDCDHWHLCEAAPALTNYRNTLYFNWYNLKAFINPKFLTAYIDYQCCHQLRPYMLSENLLTEDMFCYDAVGNECDFQPLEQMIAEGRYYTPERMKVFEGRQFPDSVSPCVIGSDQQVLLDSIASLLLRRNTNVQIVISPLFDQIRLNPQDVNALTERFGEERVHDFSGPNEWNSDYKNYYEASHYRRPVAIDVLRKIQESRQE